MRVGETPGLAGASVGGPAKAVASAREMATPGFVRPPGVGAGAGSGVRRRGFRVRWPVVIPVGILALALIAWSLMVRLPRAARAVRAAWSLAEWPRAGAGVAGAGAANLADLRAAAEVVAARMVGSRAEFLEVVAEVEAGARERGWNVEVTVAPPERAPGGLEGFTRYAARLELSESRGAGAGAAFPVFLEWLAGLSRRSKPVDVSALSLEGGLGGCSRARVDLHVLGRTANEDPASE